MRGEWNFFLKHWSNLLSFGSVVTWKLIEVSGSVLLTRKLTFLSIRIRSRRSERLHPFGPKQICFFFNTSFPISSIYSSLSLGGLSFGSFNGDLCSGLFPLKQTLWEILLSAAGSLWCLRLLIIMEIKLIWTSFILTALFDWETKYFPLSSIFEWVILVQFYFYLYYALCL